MFSGQRLKEIREAQGMSQASVAKHLGISRSSYFNWENGKTKPNQKNLSVLAELFGVAETYFLSEHEIVEVYLELNEENRQEALRLTKALLSILQPLCRKAKSTCCSALLLQSFRAFISRNWLHLLW